MTSRALVRGQLYAVAAMAIWSTNYIAGRTLRDSVTPATIATFRALVASVPLAVWLVATQGWPRPARPVLRELIALGFLGIFASQYMTYLALHWSLATNAIILNAASPLVTAGLAVGPSAAAYACWNVAVRDLGAAYATMFNNVLPIFGMLLGGLVLHERVTMVQVLASGLIIAGIVIAYRSLPMTSAAPGRSRAR